MDHKVDGNPAFEPADSAPERPGPATPFRRHKYLSYQGYSFPWYAALLWIGYFVGGILYFVKYVLLP